MAKNTLPFAGPGILLLIRPNTETPMLPAPQDPAAALLLFVMLLSAFALAAGGRMTTSLIWLRLQGCGLTGLVCLEASGMWTRDLYGAIWLLVMALIVFFGQCILSPALLESRLSPRVSASLSARPLTPEETPADGRYRLILAAGLVLLALLLVRPGLDRPESVAAGSLALPHSAVTLFTALCLLFLGALIMSYDPANALRQRRIPPLPGGILTLGNGCLLLLLCFPALPLRPVLALSLTLVLLVMILLLAGQRRPARENGGRELRKSVRKAPRPARKGRFRLPSRQKNEKQAGTSAELPANSRKQEHGKVPS